MPKTYFRPKLAVAFLAKRAREKGLLPLGQTRTGPTALGEVRVIPWRVRTAQAVLRGDRRYSVAKHHEDDLRERLGITSVEWASITEVVLDEEEGSQRGARIGHILQALAARGLERVITLLPRELPDEEIERFCVPARIITDEEWQSSVGTPLEALSSSDEAHLSQVVRLNSGVLLNTWLGREHRHTVLFGEPGEGKTTAVWLFVAEEYRRLAAKEGEAGVRVRDGKVPLVLPLRTISVGESGDLIALAAGHAISLLSLEEADREFLKHWLETEARDGRLLLILDGFDELPSSARAWLRHEIERLGSTTSVVLTSRYHADPGEVMRVYRSLRMVPLRWWIIDEHVHRYFEKHPGGTELANALRAKLRLVPGLRQLARNPLLLAALCAEQARSGISEKTRCRADLLIGAFTTLLERGDERRGFRAPRILRNEEKLHALAQLAWSSFRLFPAAMSPVEIARTFEQARRCFIHDPPASAEALLEELTTDGILVGLGTGNFTFLLRRFHETGVALYLARRLTSLDPAEAERLLLSRSGTWKRGAEWPDFRPLNHPACREIWPLLAGVIGTSRILVEAAASDWRNREDLTGSRLRQLAEILGEFLAANGENHGVVRECQGLLTEVTQAILDRVASALLIPGLPGSWIPMPATLPPETLVPRIAQRMAQATSDRQKCAYALSLGEIGTDEARQHLELLIESGNSGDDLQDHAALALGHVGDSAARDVLLRLVTSETRKTLLLSCMSGLASIGDAQSRNALVQILRSRREDPDVALDALRQCETLFGPEIEDHLIELAAVEAKKLSKKTGEYERRCADDLVQASAKILGRIGRRASAAKLKRLLNHPLSVHAQTSVMAAIAEIGDSEDRAFLHALTRGEKFAEPAAIALVAAGDEIALRTILDANTVEGLNESTRQAWCEAAPTGAVPKVLEFLIGRLRHDGSVSVRKAAALSLGRLGGPKALETLRSRLEALGVNDDLGFACARSLALNGDTVGESALLQVLRDNSQPMNLRILALYAAGRTDFPEARETLYNLATAPDASQALRVRAFDALGTIQREQGWRALSGGDWERP